MRRLILSLIAPALLMYADVVAAAPGSVAFRSSADLRISVSTAPPLRLHHIVKAGPRAEAILSIEPCRASGESSMLVSASQTAPATLRERGIDQRESSNQTRPVESRAGSEASTARTAGTCILTNSRKDAAARTLDQQGRAGGAAGPSWKLLLIVPD